MRKIIFSIFAALMFICPLFAQDARQRNVETIVQDVMAALPAQNAADCYEQMADLAKAAPQSVTYLASKLQPVSDKPVSNNILEYAISGVVRYATDPVNAGVKENVKKGLEQAIAAATDKYIKQFLQSQLNLMLPYSDGFPAHMQATYAGEDVKTLLKSKDENDQCRGLWLAVETLGAKAEKNILSALKSDSRAVRTTALLAYEQLAGDEFYAQVAKLYKKLSPEAKADIIYWFGEADVKAQLPLVMSELGAAGELGNGLFQGPLALDVAIDEESVKIKKLTGPVAGDADCMLFPNLESGNVFFKACSKFGGAELAAMVAGPTAPCVLTSRGDSTKTKLYSIALACLSAK